MSRKYIYISISVAIIIIAGVLAYFLLGSPKQEEEVTEEVKTEVTVAGASTLQGDYTITRSAIVKPNEVSVIVARTGGRITALDYKLGDEVKAGTRIGRIDGSGEPNIAAVQYSAAAKSLGLFSTIEEQAKVALDNAVALTERNLDSAKIGVPTNSTIQSNQVNLADTGIQQAQESLSKAQELDDDGIATAVSVKAAEIGVEAAKLAKEQAQSQSVLAKRGSGDALKAAKVAAENAVATRERSLAELASQRAQLQGAVNVAGEQIRFQTITSPVNGTIRSLSVRAGDFVQPNQIIGEVVGANSAALNVTVNYAVKEALGLGDAVDIEIDSNHYVGVLDSIAGAASEAGLFDARIVTQGAVPADVYGKTAKVNLPARTTTDTFLVPLDAIAVRSAGTFVFIVDESTTVQSIPARVVAYRGDHVEVAATIGLSDLVVTEGTRLLEDGKAVALAK